MEHPITRQLKDRLSALGPKLKTYRYPALVLLLGLLLVLLPGKTTQKSETPEAQTPAPTEPEEELDYCQKTERELASILSQIHGAGRVTVMLTLKTGQTVLYQSNYENTRQSGSSESTTTRQTTVILQRDGAYDEAAVVRTEYPVFRGALIVSEGADNPAVRLALSEAAAALLGLGQDKITVVKMK